MQTEKIGLREFGENFADCLWSGRTNKDKPVPPATPELGQPDPEESIQLR
jgi:hypothetical protein